MGKYRLLSLVFWAFVAFSCNGWLDVQPEDEIDEDALFASGDGYRHALNGIYYGMADQTLYGEDLTWGVVDALGRVYSEYSVYSSGNRGQNLFYWGIYNDNFEQAQLKSEIEYIWGNVYKTVANCNNLIQNIERESSETFTYLERERNMIWGEALALRAFVQLDMLRLFAPSLAMNPQSRTYIPYVSVYPSYVPVPLTVDSCLNSIIRDLKEAKGLLWKADSVKTDFGVSRRFETSSLDDNSFIEDKRGFRLNYYAATVILARACLYAQRLDEAYQYAKEIIDYNEETGDFEYESYYSIADGDSKLYADIIWGLESVYLDEYISVYNNLTNPQSWYWTYLSVANMDEIFGDETEDVRWEKWVSDEDDRFIKYEKYEDNSTEAKISNTMIPMIRMTEAYYIAAEAIYKKNLDEAIDYLAIVKDGRNASGLRGVTEDNFMDELIKDARREWLGEGQLFYMYKRLGMDIPSENGQVIKLDEKHAVLPIPDTETNIN